MFKSYFADQVYYRVGNVTEVSGPEAVAAYLRDLPSIGLTITRMDVRGPGRRTPWPWRSTPCGGRGRWTGRGYPSC